MTTETADVVIVGVGAVGGIIAAELGKAGMKVIGLERGPRLTTQDFRSLSCRGPTSRLNSRVICPAPRLPLLMMRNSRSACRRRFRRSGFVSIRIPT